MYVLGMEAVAIINGNKIKKEKKQGKVGSLYVRGIPD